MNPARDWWRPALTWRTAPLLPLAWLFGAVIALRRGLYGLGILTATRLPVPVVVVGNLTVGGSGKTPLVIFLAAALAARGFTPGVISRGYGSKGGSRGAASGARQDSPREVHGDSKPEEVGDEPLLIRRKTGVPVFVGAARAQVALALLAAHPAVDLIISDDGLQHLAMGRDFEIAVFDARGAGNGALLPAGPLREPLRRAARLDALVSNGAAMHAIAPGRASISMRLVPGDFHSLSDAGRHMAPADFVRMQPRGSPVAAVAGIGNPARFFSALRELGLDISEHAFPDHHAYRPADLAAISANVIVMTEKDALKCNRQNDPRVWVLPVAAAVDDELANSIVEKLRGPKAA